MICSVKYPSPVGLLTISGRDGRIIGLWIEGQKYFAGNIKEPMTPADTPVLRQAREWLDRYFAGRRPSPAELPLAPEGSDFRRKAWDILCRIPYGETVTYGEIARRMAADVTMDGNVAHGAGKGSPQAASAFKIPSARAVGGAVAHNPISIIIPCHRVVGAGGDLTGYAGGIPAKKKLLELEGADMTKFPPVRLGHL